MTSTKHSLDKLDISAFDAAEFLDSEEIIAEYLNAAMSDPDPDIFLMALSNVARARGIAMIAEKSGRAPE
jgi:probable addiction module antidote protein